VTASDIQRLFGTLPGLFLIVKADADFTIVGASDAYLKETFTDTGIFGRKLFEVFPANPDDIHAISVNATPSPSWKASPKASSRWTGVGASTTSIARRTASSAVNAAAWKGACCGRSTRAWRAPSSKGATTAR
jgi:hypothetical protein